MDNIKIKNRYTYLFGVVLLMLFVSILFLGACTETESPKLVSEKCTVTFDTNGGSPISNIVVDKNDYVQKPDDPTKDGYIFAFWAYKKSDIDPNTPSDYEYNWQRFDFDEDGTSDRYIEQDMTLYAKYEKIVAVVSFESNNAGRFEDKVISMLYKSEWSYVDGVYTTYGELPAPTKDGYEFCGWFLFDVGYREITPASRVTPSTQILQSDSIQDITLYAWWGSNVEREDALEFTLMNDTHYYVKVLKGIDVVVPTQFNNKPVLLDMASTVLEDFQVENISVYEDNPYYTSIDGVIYDKDITRLIVYPRNKLIQKLMIPSTVVEISDYAFFYCNLSNWQIQTEIVLPQGLITIGNDAFALNYLVKLQIPSSLKFIGDYAFFTCRYMEYINIPIGVEYIGSSAFGSCYDSTIIHCERPEPPKDEKGGWIVDGWAYNCFGTPPYGTTNPTVIWDSKG
ncbi:MAG: leucine-rich repeat protein [Firmicutes bacterium]|nr:leucine-rich repeat protein [Bacillota bacterium]MCL1953161.1 leucine-rich repeat protein [Bacillota bacterium]